jgi:uncharacterized membrane protein
MVKVPLKTFITVVFLILLSSSAYAINLGSLVKDKSGEVTKEESTKFKMLFWNAESEAYDVRLSAKESPKDWTVIIDPAEFVLDKSIGEEYVSLPNVDENVKAKVVNVFVRPDKDSKPGNYSVVVKAETILKQSEINGVTVVPERLFKFEVDIKGPVSSVDDYKASTENKIDYNIVSKEKSDENISDTSDKKYFYFFALAMIVLFSIILYKK